MKGARPRGVLAVAAAGSQGVMLVLVFAALTQAVGGAVLLRADARTFQSWDADRSSVTASINPNAFEDPATNEFAPDVAKAYHSFGTIFREMDADGTAVLSVHDSNDDTGRADAPLSSYEPLQGNSMIVNNAYLARQRIIDAHGERIARIPPQPDEITLLIPERLESEQRRLVTEWSESTLVATDPIEHREPRKPFVVKPIIVANGQSLFNYGSTQKMERWMQRSPVVAVVSPESHYVSDWMLLGVAANNGNVVFTDPTEFRRASAAADLTQRFSGVDSPAALAAAQLRERQTALILATGTAIAGLLTLSITVGLLSAMYADAVRFSSFLRRTHGYTAARIHGLFVSVVVCGSAAVVLSALFVARVLHLVAEETLVAVALLMVALVAGMQVIATAMLDRRARASLIARR